MNPVGESSPLSPNTLGGQIARESDVANSNVGAVPPLDVERVGATPHLRWAEDNCAAIKAYNQRVEVSGVFSDELRYF
ncbi:type II toxin-antitoxin system CcdA family antitoxin [Pseudomonas amygdali]|uniref:type II toxin-antitoxin system CcdA family antitoxin n=1 Tax=Pseudomonas amygdali TaxID=47877 RepID=UPI0009E4091D